jgi:hypothetical protein
LLVIILVSERKMMSALFCVIAAIFKSKFDDKPVKLRELQFWISNVIGGGSLTAPVTCVLSVPYNRNRRLRANML